MMANTIKLSLLSVFAEIHVLSAWQSLPLAGSRIHGVSSSSSSSSSRLPAKDWSVADNWDALSSENPLNSVPDSSEIMNQDVAAKAAQSILPDNHGEDIAPWSEEDTWVRGIIEDISSPMSSESLYDTAFDSPGPSSVTPNRSKKEKSFEDQMGDEIAKLVRCNQSPEDMLVQAGRALPPLTEEQKLDVAQLVQWTEDGGEMGQWQATKFFQKAVSEIFHTHATKQEGEEEPAMDAKAVSRWMTQSIGNGLDSKSEDTTPQNKMGKDMVSWRQQKKSPTNEIGPHDSRVLKLLSKYGTYGTGKMTLENFQDLYLDALTRLPTGQLVAGGTDLLTLRNADHIHQVWRDFQNHGIVGPTEEQYNIESKKLQAKYGTIQQQTDILLEHGNFMDECEILEFSTYDPPTSGEQTEEDQRHHDKNQKYIKQSSFEKIELAKDNKTPVYVKDGEFIFIDEETCVGCMQCVNAAPSSFLMLESGRARAFEQRGGADVSQGVAACPVNCMHRVSFDELKELETARDKGDGRTDHKHIGHRRGPTPLHVSGMDSDNNHRSSWYHYMKGKCCTSGQCPQRGCYNCPSYKEGENPYFKERAKAAESTRANYFVENGSADLWRKTVDL